MLEADDILGKVVRIVLCDRRVIEGMLLCMDRHLNFALGDAMVYKKSITLLNNCKG